MAQIKIRKFNPGGVLTTEMGDTFTLEEVEQLVRENPTNENLKDIVNELRAGKNVTHNISDNWSSVTDDQFSKGQRRRIAKDPNSFSRRLAATFNTQVNQYGEDVNETTKLLAAAKSRTSSTASSSSVSTSGSGSGSGSGSSSSNLGNITLISSGGGAQFEYDDDGNFVNNSFTNSKLLSLLNDLDAYFSNEDPDVMYKFKGISSDVRRTLKDMHAANPNLFKELINKVKSGKIIEGSPEASILLSVGIGSNMTKEQLEQSKKDKALEDYFINGGFTEDQYKALLPFVELDAQGLRLKDGVQGSPWITGQNYYFNEGYDGPFASIVRGKILYKDRFYDAEQLAKSGLITDWVKALKEHRFADADALIKWDWKGVADKYDYQLFDNQKYYDDFLYGKRYLDVTGRYEKDYDNDGNVNQIFGYYDPSDSSIYDAFGFVDPSKIKYARYDSMGNLLDEDYNISYLRKAVTPWKHVSVFKEKFNEDQVVLPTIVTNKGEGVLGMDVTYDPVKGTIQFRGPAVKEVLEDDGDAIQLDGEMAQILSPEFFENLQYVDEDLISQFRETILSLVGSKWGNFWTRNELEEDDWTEILKPTYGKDANRLAKKMVNYIKSYISDGWTFFGWGGGLDRDARVHSLAVFQDGGLFTGSTAMASSAPRVVKSDEYVKPATAEAGAFDFDEFTDADWWELAGLGADLSSVVTGATGLSPVSAITGFAGTGASFIADIKRDGFQWGDLGNFGLGLLFDIGSLIPGLGTASAAGGIMVKLKKSLPMLMKLAGMAGIGSSLSLAVNKINSGEELTMKDLRVIMNGVLGTYTLAKQGVGIRPGKKAGVEFDADVRKMHIEEINASNLSDGQKAAMKHFFDGGDYSAGLTGEQARIYQQFVADGGDETALKMLIGENDVFKSIRADRAILEKAKNALSGGPELTPDELKRYNKILEDSKVRSRMSQEEYDKLTDASTENTRLKQALETLETNPTDVAAQNVVNGFRANPEYKDFFTAWDAIPKEARIDVLNNTVTSGTDAFHAGMFERTNPHYRAGEADDVAAAWAADVKNRDAVVNDILGRYDQSAVKAADDALVQARAKRDKLGVSGSVKLKDLKADLDNAVSIKSKAEANVAAAKSKVKTATTDADKVAAQEELRIANAELKKANDALKTAQDKHDAVLEVNAARNRKIKADKDFIAWKNSFAGNSDIELDPTTGLYRKSTRLTQELGDVRTQFKETGVLTKTQAEAERTRLLAGNTEDALRANFAQERAAQVKKLFDEELPKIRKTSDEAVDAEYFNLSDAEKAEVSKILKKKLSDLSEDEIAKLNYYTAKQSGVVTSEADAAFAARKTAVTETDAFKNFELGPEVKIETVNAFIKASGLPASKFRLTEVEWAKIQKADDQGLALMATLKKKGISDNVAEKIMRSVATEVEKPAETEGWTLFGRKKKSSPSATATTDKIFELDMDKFKTRYKDDNTLKGRILGRSSKQRKYAEETYGLNRKRTNLKNMPNRYYQPMLHGLHYNLMRDPIQYTPWYEPKEITIQIDEEE